MSRFVNAAILPLALLASASPAIAMQHKPSEPSQPGGGGTNVPEPGALAMMGSGMAAYGAAVAAYRRKKRAKKN